jgi:tripartite-type tricarboxylate transporter receptor subunit TctC
VIAGDTQMASLAPLAIMPQVQAGRLRALAISTRSARPCCPSTFEEAGVLDVATAWIGLVAPARTPAPVIDRLNREFVAAMRDPATADKLKAQYRGARTGHAGRVAAHAGRTETLGAVIRRSGATAD